MKKTIILTGITIMTLLTSCFVSALQISPIQKPHNLICVPIEPLPPIQAPQSRFLGIPLYWNNLSWALAFHVDDLPDPTGAHPNQPNTFVDQQWFIHQPITMMMFSKYIHTYCPSNYVYDYHSEYGSHSWNHVFMGGANYVDTLYWFQTSMTVMNMYAPNISLWSNKCITFSVPGGDYNPFMVDCASQTGFRVMGTNNSLNPSSDYEWMTELLCSYLSVGSNWLTTLNAFKSNHSFADVMIHPQDTFDNNYFSFIENETSGWHCTWGEIRCYSWYRNCTSVMYLNSSDNIDSYMVHMNNSDDRIWSVPVTFNFYIPHWSGLVFVDNRTINNDIGVFYPSVTQHMTQTMREGYRYNNCVLSVSALVDDNSVIRVGVA